MLGCTFGASSANAQGAGSSGHFDWPKTVGPIGPVIPISTLGKAAVGLEVKPVERKFLPLEITTQGKIESIPSREYAQHSPVSGRVSEVMVSLGDTVTKGQILLELESQELNKLAAQILQSKQDIEAQIAQQTNALDDEVVEGQARIQLAQENYDRDTKLLNERIGSQKAMQNSLALLEVARTQLKTAKSKKEIVIRSLRTRLNLVLQPLRQQLHMLGSSDVEIESMLKHNEPISIVPVRSARSGVITSINASAGQGIDSTVRLFTVSDLSKVWATAQIYEDDMSRVKLGQKVKIRVSAFQGATFDGTLSYIGDHVDIRTRTLPVRAQIDNQNLRLKPDMYADLSVQIDAPSLSILLPADSVVERNGHKLVFLEVQGGYEPVRVTIGRTFGDSVEITAGLDAGQQVVVHGAFQLAAEMLKSGGDLSQFQQATEGEHEQNEVAKEKHSTTISPQLLAVSIAIAFILGLVINAVASKLRAPSPKGSATAAAPPAAPSNPGTRVDKQDVIADSNQSISDNEPFPRRREKL